MLQPSCKDCTDRYVGCHATCEKYKEWAEEQKKINEAIKKERLKEKRLDDVKVDGVRRSKSIRAPKTLRSRKK